MNISSKSSIELVDRFCAVGDMLSVWNKFSQPITFHVVLDLKRGSVQLLCKSLYDKNVNPTVGYKRNWKVLVQGVNRLKIKCKTLWHAVNGED